MASQAIEPNLTKARLNKSAILPLTQDITTKLQGFTHV